MKENAEITYIDKDYITRTITLNKFDEVTLKLKLKDIFKIKTYDRYTDFSLRSFVFKNDIIFIKITNFVFSNSYVIIGGWNREEKIILENCSFKSHEILVRFFDNIEIINPIILSKDKSLLIKIEESCNVNIDLIENKKIDNLYNIKIKDIKNLNLISNNNLEQLTLNQVLNVKLKNFNSKLAYEEIYFLPSKSNLTYYTIKLENYLDSQKKHFDDIKNLELNECSIKFDGGINFIKLKSLILKSSNIISDKFVIMENLENLIINDNNDSILDNFSYFNIGEVLVLGNRVFKNTNKTEQLIIDNSVLSNKLAQKRIILTHILKEYKEKLLLENQKRLQDFIDENRKKEDYYKETLKKMKIKDLKK